MFIGYNNSIKLLEFSLINNVPAGKIDNLHVLPNIQPLPNKPSIRCPINKIPVIELPLFLDITSCVIRWLITVQILLDQDSHFGGIVHY